MKTVYAAGRDPLGIRWQQGERETHPRWTDAEFWREVYRQKALLLAHSQRQYARQRANKETARCN